MKILLTNVPDLHVAKTTDDWDLDASDIGVFPPLGLMYLAGALHNQGRHHVKLLDCVLNRYSLDEVARIAVDYAPDLIGLTCYTPTIFDAIKLSAKFREVLPAATIVWGGPHTLLFPTESMEHSMVDILVMGEGEEVFPKLCDALEDGTSLDGIPGLVLREGSGLRQTGAPGFISDINSIPFPAFDLVDYQRYYSAVGTGLPVGTICSSRGCPFHCTFCCKPYSSYRSRSVDNILLEMKEYYTKGIREFFFFDDLFNATPKRVMDISQGILDLGMDICWAFRGRVDAVTPEMLTLAKRAGCRQIFYGVEAATNDGLKEIRKNITIEQAMSAVRMTRKAGILSSTNWIIGLPHHKSRQDILRLIDTAVSIDSDFAQFNICIAYHGTEIFEAGVSNGLFNPNLWRDFARTPIPNFAEPIWEQYLSRQELSALLRLCYRRFYFRPLFILRKLLRIRHLRELKLFAKGALTLLGVGGYHRKNHAEGIDQDISREG